MLAAVIAVVLGLLAIPSPESVAVEPSGSPLAFFYDGQHSPALVASDAFERGPPVRTTIASDDAAVGWSSDTLARSERATGPMGYTYDDVARLAQVARGVASTPSHVPAAHAPLGAFNRGGVAAKSLPDALTVGRNAEEGVHVYFGVSGGKNVYAGVTNNVGRRTAEQADRFVVRPITTEGLTRGQARAVEQALIVRNPDFVNKINSISPTHAWYQDAVDWGEAWLVRNGY